MLLQQLEFFSKNPIRAETRDGVLLVCLSSAQVGRPAGVLGTCGCSGVVNPWGGAQAALGEIAVALVSKEDTG